MRRPLGAGTRHGPVGARTVTEKGREVIRKWTTGRVVHGTSQTDSRRLDRSSPGPPSSRHRSRAPEWTSKFTLHRLGRPQPLRCPVRLRDDLLQTEVGTEYQDPWTQEGLILQAQLAVGREVKQGTLNRGTLKVRHEDAGTVTGDLIPVSPSIPFTYLKK